METKTAKKESLGI